MFDNVGSLELVVWMVMGVVALRFTIWYWTLQKKKEIYNSVKALSKGTMKMTPAEFLKMREQKFEGNNGRKKLYASQFNFTGVYILHNTTKDKYFVGKGTKVLDQVYKQFNGSGNGDVYVDYKNGDEWLIEMLALSDSGYDSINALEKDTIKTYKAYDKGYNRSRGRK